MQMDNIDEICHELKIFFFDDLLGSSQDNGILTIPNIQPSYAGSYVCTGTDKGGTIGQAKTIVTIIPRDDSKSYI